MLKRCYQDDDVAPSQPLISAMVEIQCRSGEHVVCFAFGQHVKEGLVLLMNNNNGDSRFLSLSSQLGSVNQHVEILSNFSIHPKSIRLMCWTTNAISFLTEDDLIWILPKNDMIIPSDYSHILVSLEDLNNHTIVEFECFLCSTKLAFRAYAVLRDSENAWYGLYCSDSWISSKPVWRLEENISLFVREKSFRGAWDIWCQKMSAGCVKKKLQEDLNKSRDLIFTFQNGKWTTSL